MKLKKELKKYGYSTEDYEYKKVMVYTNTMNHVYENGTLCRALVPKEFAATVHEVTVNFTMDSIRFFDIKGNELFNTVGPEYDDIVTPTAFIVSEERSDEEKMDMEVDWRVVEEMFKNFGYLDVYVTIRMKLMMESDNNKSLRNALITDLMGLFVLYEENQKETFGYEDLEFDLLFAY